MNLQARAVGKPDVLGEFARDIEAWEFLETDCFRVEFNRFLDIGNDGAKIDRWSGKFAGNLIVGDLCRRKCISRIFELFQRLSSSFLSTFLS